MSVCLGKDYTTFYISEVPNMGTKQGVTNHSNLLLLIVWIAIPFITDDVQRINPDFSDFNDPLTFNPAPPAGQSFNFQ